MPEQTLSERHPLGTEVRILRDCRRWPRATGKIGVISRYIPFVIPEDVFPLKLDKNTTISAASEGDIKGEMPVIRYGRFGRIRGCQCFWISLEDERRAIEEVRRAEASPQ